jgi:thiol-disulfide isomerase/thioredoxin
MKIPFIFFMLAFFSGQGVSPEKPYALMVGDLAPALEVNRFVKGEPFSDFQKGQVYVIEFWATWCVPCKESIPHLTELQKKYGEKVRILGVSVWEPREDAVEPFVKEWGQKMDYWVAMDKAGCPSPIWWIRAGIFSAFRPLSSSTKKVGSPGSESQESWASPWKR